MIMNSSIGSSGNSHHHHEPLCELRVADSVFLGFVSTHPQLSAIEQFRQDLIDHHHPDAAHVPYAASIGGGAEEGYDDDDEPTGSGVGRALLKELNRYKKQLRRRSTIKIRGGSAGKDMLFESGDGDGEECSLESQSSGQCGTSVATAIIVVRYFEKRLLGVTCGRLRAVYERTARLALHRHLNGRDKPFIERFAFDTGSDCNHLYGLGAGDTELILGVIPPDNEQGAEEKQQEVQSSSSIVEKLTSELQFEGMVGSKNEVLPRLQHLQADLPVVGGNGLIPIYRYPGNYSGMEWPTHPWSPTTLSVKTLVEEALQPLYNQHMNHCVTNLYRDGTDRIDRHSDKDLDLNREGVIVSVSLGSARIMEVRDRQYPHDRALVELPPNSMFVLGPYTNARFTHAILPAREEHEQNRRVSFCSENIETAGGNAKCSVEDGGRISLTFRDVRTFLDVKTQRLFVPRVKDGVITGESLSEAVRSVRDEDKAEKISAMLIATAIGTAAAYATGATGAGRKVAGGKDATPTNSDAIDMLRSLSTAVFSASASYWLLQRLRSNVRHQREEKAARLFFSKKSASGNVYF